MSVPEGSVAEKIDIGRLEAGSTFTFLELASQLENGNSEVTEAHIRTLTASINAGTGLETRTYFSQEKREFVKLPTLSGPPLFAALYAFSKALRCEPFASAAREVLKSWVVGDSRSVGLAMTQLKWGADLKSSSPPNPSQCFHIAKSSSFRVDSSEEFVVPDATKTAAMLRTGNSRDRSAVLEAVRQAAAMDGHQIAPFLPALVDALATEYRDRILEVLSLAIRTGLKVDTIMPLLAGLLLDRDYYDAVTVRRLYQCLIAAVEVGANISMAWPYIGICMEESGLKLKLLFLGAHKGLPIAGHMNFLLSHLKFVIVPNPSMESSELTWGLEQAAYALKILTLGVARRDFSRLQLDGEAS
jgi:hypothetical protein